MNTLFMPTIDKNGKKKFLTVIMLNCLLGKTYVKYILFNYSQFLGLFHDNIFDT